MADLTKCAPQQLMENIGEVAIRGKVIDDVFNKARLLVEGPAAPMDGGLHTGSGVRAIGQHLLKGAKGLPYCIPDITLSRMYLPVTVLVGAVGGLVHGGRHPMFTEGLNGLGHDAFNI
jgi:hypothetical protein